MTKTKLRKLIKLHADTVKLREPSVSAYARSIGLHPSTLTAWLSGKRKNLGSTTQLYLEMKFLASQL